MPRADISVTLGVNDVPFSSAAGPARPGRRAVRGPLTAGVHGSTRQQAGSNLADTTPGRVDAGGAPRGARFFVGLLRAGLVLGVLGRRSHLGLRLLGGRLVRGLSGPRRSNRRRLSPRSRLLSGRGGGAT